MYNIYIKGMIKFHGACHTKLKGRAARSISPGTARLLVARIWRRRRGHATLLNSLVDDLERHVVCEGNAAKHEENCRTNDRAVGVLWG